MFILFTCIFSFSFFDLKSNKQKINNIRPKNEQNIDILRVFFDQKSSALNVKAVEDLENFALKNKGTTKKFQIISYINKHAQGSTHNELLEARVNIIKKYLLKHGMKEEFLSCEVKHDECMVKIEKDALNDAVAFVFEKQALIEVLS